MSNLPPTTATRLRRSPTTRLRRSTRTRLWGVAAVIIALVWAFPAYWIVNGALQPVEALRSPTPVFVPTDITLDAFGRVLDGQFFASLRLSLVVTLICVALAVVCAFVAAVAISRFRFRGRVSFIIVVLTIQMIPPEALFISQYRMLNEWSLYNTVAGLSLLYVAAVLPFTVWLLRGFVDGVPIELEEAAMVDGCSRVRAFFTITFPLLAPGLIASGVFAFLQAWNEYTLAVVVMEPDNRTLPLWLRGMTTVSNEAIDWPAVMAGSVLVALPVIIFFMMVQTRMTQGLVSGAVKG
ncbi:carbohydrate ABC transporter permease [Ornithinimicrobium ciconiae]|uniref:Carbohydrate ABC transporter permease n=1 Tax=Ornithinimicrobium ciconiae TaxID=2594265 RepID=A0A516G9M5_9MICO|nr:carbohydrate ABC transporter permease [Ornithinimicrobium ciconiae]QDO88223.1 carbohydrate ABC transporter permease [Ornithinimicrobium ciconiae]